MNKKILIGLSFLVLMFAFVCATCDMGVIEKDAQNPVIIQQPTVSDIAPYVGARVTLTIEAKSPDGGKLSYQWYKYTTDAQYTGQRGSSVKDATDASYPLTLTASGPSNYYVMVTNTKGKSQATIQSARLTFNVNNVGDAQYPVIIFQPADSTYYFGGTLTVDPISVTAEVSDGGALSYKWYQPGEFDNEGGQELGETSASFTPAISAVGTYYYYVVVTNTNNQVSGNTASSTFSNPVAITIMTTEDKTSNATFTVNTATKYQYVRGFGGMDTPWTNVKAINIEDYETMYNPDKLGYNLMRIMILANNVNIDETMRILVEGDGIDPPARPDQYEGVKIVNKYGGYVLASPWSPPAEWKTNDSINGGGKLKTANYLDFANYLNSFSQHMYDKGAPIYAISMQNEPSYTDNKYEGCQYSPQEHVNWWTAVRRFTDNGPQGYGGGQEWPTVRTMSGESHNEISWQYPALDDPTVRGYIDIVGRHIYGSWRNPDDAAAKLNGKEVWMTEHNVNGGNEASYPNDSTWNHIWKFMNEVDLTIRLNGENGFIWWTIKRFYSMIGDGDFSTTEHTILPRGYGLSAYAKFAKEMWRCQLTGSGTLGGSSTAISSSNFNPTTNGNTDTGAKATAFVSDDGNTISLVMYTPTNESGSGGYNLGTVKIALPDNFTIRKATAMRITRGENERIAKVESENVTVGTDRHSAYVELPVGNILSVRFTK